MTVVFFDGYCGLCDRLVRFLLLRDKQAQLRFAPLQGDVAERTLKARGHDPSVLDTLYVIADWKTEHERVLTRWSGVMHAVSRIGGVWAVLARIGSLVPSPIGNAIYRVIARTRYRIFGRFDSCALPPPEFRQRFLDRSEE